MEIAPGVYSLTEPVRGALRNGFYVHAFLIDYSGELTLVDTLQRTDAASVLAAIEQIDKTIADLKHIVMTHGHRSHLGGLAALKQMSGATVYAHEWEADIISGDRKAQAVTLRPQWPVITWFAQAGVTLAKHPPCAVDVALRDGDYVGPLQVVHTPGHSPGHLAFHWPEQRLLIAGDAVATWPEFWAGWRGFVLNAKHNRESTHRMAELEPEIVGVGHGEPITQAGAERMGALAKQIDREARQSH
jgi:glyoxylase-like metal-dependent hydrolase (beta-lactamase superfamily II)